MEFNPWVVTMYKIIPVILIGGIIIWTVYSIIMNKRKSNSSANNFSDSPNLYLRILGLKIKKRIINIVLLVLSGIPLLVYPMVIIANVMTLASLHMADNTLHVIMGLLFVAFTSSYLLTYIICFIIYLIKKKKDESILVTTIPLIHLAIIFLILMTNNS